MLHEIQLSNIRIKLLLGKQNKTINKTKRKNEVMNILITLTSRSFLPLKLS